MKSETICENGEQNYFFGNQYVDCYDEENKEILIIENEFYLNKEKVI